MPIKQAKAKKKKKTVVKTLRGVEAWNKPKPKKRKSGKKLSGTGAGFIGELMKTVIENAKPVAGGIASDMVVNTITKDAPQITAVTNAITFLIGSALDVALPKKAGVARDIIHGATICSGKDAVSELAKKFGVTSLSGYNSLGAVHSLGAISSLDGYNALAGEYDVTPYSVTPVSRSLAPANAGRASRGKNARDIA